MLHVLYITWPHYIGGKLRCSNMSGLILVTQEVWHIEKVTHLSRSLECCL